MIKKKIKRFLAEVVFRIRLFIMKIAYSIYHFLARIELNLNADCNNDQNKRKK